MRAAAERVLEHARATGTITLQLREELAVSLGHPPQYAHGRWTLHSQRRDRGVR